MMKCGVWSRYDYYYYYVKRAIPIGVGAAKIKPVACGDQENPSAYVRDTTKSQNG